MNTPEELLRQAFELGQQWVQDMNNDKQPTNFNEWYASNEVQQQVKKCDLADVVGRSEQFYCSSNEIPKFGIIEKCDKQCDECKNSQ